MVMVMSAVPREVWKLATTNGEIWSDNMDRIECDGYSSYAILKELNGMDNFFFGAVLTEVNHMVRYSISSTRWDNDTILIMDIPEEELYCTDFEAYDTYLDERTAAIRENGEQGVEELKPYWLKVLPSNPETAFCQANFTHIDEDWILDVIPRDYFQYETAGVNHVASMVKEYNLKYEKVAAV